MSEVVSLKGGRSCSARWIAVARGSRFSSAQNSLLENTFVAAGERSSKSSFLLHADSCLPAFLA